MKSIVINNKEYFVSQDGHIFRNGKQLKEYDNGNGYISFPLVGGKRRYVHRIVCLVYHGEPSEKSMHVNHKNGNRSDNRAENLEWLSCSENHKHAYRELGREHPKNQTGKSGFNHQYSRPIDQIDIETGKVIKTFGSKIEAAQELGVDPSAIYNAIVGRSRMKYCKGFKWAYNPEGNKFQSKFIYYFEDGKRKRKLREHAATT